MAAISQTIFSDAFSWMESCILIKISLKFVPKGPTDYNPALFFLDNGLVTNKRQTIIWTNAGPIYWRIYAALGGNELMHWMDCSFTLSHQNHVLLY